MASRGSGHVSMGVFHIAYVRGVAAERCYRSGRGRAASEDEGSQLARWRLPFQRWSAGRHWRYVPAPGQSAALHGWAAVLANEPAPSERRSSLRQQSARTENVTEHDGRSIHLIRHAAWARVFELVIPSPPANPDGGKSYEDVAALAALSVFRIW